MRERYDLWVLQAAFSSRGKITWPITRARRGNILRYTDFIEMTCPLFRRDKLDAFMAVYDPDLIGWGCDWWFLESLGPDVCGRIAVVDAIACINPHDATKETREIDRLAPATERREAWERIKQKYGIQREARGAQTYGAVVRPFPVWAAGRVMDAAAHQWRRAQRAFLRSFGQTA
jgi:hypothetical protein